MALSCGLYQIWDFTTSSPSRALDAVFKGWTKDYMMQGVFIVGKTCMRDQL